MTTLKETIKIMSKYNPIEQNALLGCNIIIDDEKEFEADVNCMFNDIDEVIKKAVLEFESEYIKLNDSGKLNLFNLVELRRKIFGDYKE